MIPPPQASPSPKVSYPTLVLPGDQIDTALHQQCSGEVVAVIAVGQNDVTRFKLRHQLAKQRLLARVFASARTQCPFQNGAGGQRDHSNQHGQRKSEPRFLGATLRIRRLVACGVRHRDRRAVQKFDRTHAPSPFPRAFALQRLTDLQRQSANQFQRQALARLAVRPTAQTARRLSSLSRRDTASWQAPSWLSACPMNKPKVVSGG